MRRSLTLFLSSLFLMAGLAACDNPDGGGGGGGQQQQQQQQPTQPQSQ